MRSFIKGLSIGILTALGSEILNETKRRKQIKKPIEKPIVNMEDPSFCHKCKKPYAFYDSKNRLICRGCGYSSHK